jgi:serine/threonine protein kinase
VNFEFFDASDEEEEDCLGWITVMEECDGDLQKELKKEILNLAERKKIATGIEAGFEYLEKIGIDHFDQKLSNFLLIRDEVKICDFGLVAEESGRRSYRQLGYTRRGSKYKDDTALCKIWN